MARDPRRIPSDCLVVEVTQKTVGGRYLLRPGKDLNEIFLGCLGRAQRLYPVEIFGVTCLSNHVHLLLGVQDVERLAEFMRHFTSNLAREVQRLHRWRGPVWGRRYSHVPVQGEEAEIERFRYLLSQGVKEHLVGRCQQWPGVHVAKYFQRGDALSGWWFDRTKECGWRARGKEYETYELGNPETVVVSQLPCRTDTPAETYRQWVAEEIYELEAMAEREREREGSSVVGAKAVQRVKPHAAPDEIDHTPCPRVHAATKQAREAFHEAFVLFLQAYREASARLRQGARDVVFPDGCFPPAGPFVRDGP